jgi:hypothetical protein
MVRAKKVIEIIQVPSGDVSLDVPSLMEVTPPEDVECDISTDPEEAKLPINETVPDLEDEVMMTESEPEVLVLAKPVSKIKKQMTSGQLQNLKKARERKAQKKLATDTQTQLEYGKECVRLYLESQKGEEEEEEEEEEEPVIVQPKRKKPRVKKEEEENAVYERPRVDARRRGWGHLLS